MAIDATDVNHLGLTMNVNLLLWIHGAHLGWVRVRPRWALWRIPAKYILETSIHSKVHVQLATCCLDNITNMCNESQGLHVIFGNAGNSW